MRRSHAILLLAVVTVLSAAVALSAERTFEKKFPATPGGTLTVRIDVGTVEVTGTSGNEVSILGQIRGRERDINDFDIAAEKTSSGVELHGKVPGSRHWFWNNADLDAKFTIQVPKKYDLRIETSGGDISVTAVQGKMEGETSGGNLSLNDVEGNVDLETSGGNIRAEKVRGMVHMETSGGNINIVSATGDVDVSTSGGSIKISEVDGKIKAETSGGDVVVKARNAGKGIFAETSGGDIDIYVSKDVAANIDASTSGGEVECEFPITMKGKIDESRVRGAINGGGNTIHAHTSGGNVRIRPLD